LLLVAFTQYCYQEDECRRQATKAAILEETVDLKIWKMKNYNYNLSDKVKIK
jgi:hypothetical protein